MPRTEQNRSAQLLPRSHRREPYEPVLGAAATRAVRHGRRLAQTHERDEGSRQRRAPPPGAWRRSKARPDRRGVPGTARPVRPTTRGATATASEAGGPRHRVVDAARDPGRADGDGRECRGRQRGHGQRHPGAEHEHPGQDVGQVRRRRPDAGQEQRAGGGQHRPDGHRQPRADARAECAGPRREGEHHQGERQGGAPGGGRCEPRLLLQREDQEHHEDAQRRVDEEGHEVHDPERARGEDRQRHHRGARPELDDARRRPAPRARPPRWSAPPPTGPAPARR